MKKSILFLIVLVISLSVFSITKYSSAPIPDGETDWELPMEDDIVYFRFDSLVFKNKKKDLKQYYTDQLFVMELNSKISSELSKKGGKYFSNTNYLMVFGTTSSQDSYSFGADGKLKYKDTIDGMLFIQTITTNKTALQIFGDKSSNFSVTGKIRAIFTKNIVSLRIRGFTIKNMTLDYKKGTIQNNEAFLEDSYNAFLKDSKKDKAEQKFYVEFKELVNSFKTILVEQLEKAIKVNEMD